MGLVTDLDLIDGLQTTVEASCRMRGDPAEVLSGDILAAAPLSVFTRRTVVKGISLLAAPGLVFGPVHGSDFRAQTDRLSPAAAATPRASLDGIVFGKVPPPFVSDHLIPDNEDESWEGAG